MDFVERICDSDELACDRHGNEKAVPRDVARGEDADETDDQERDPLLLRRIRILEFPAEKPRSELHEDRRREEQNSSRPPKPRNIRTSPRSRASGETDDGVVARSVRSEIDSARAMKSSKAAIVTNAFEEMACACQSIAATTVSTIRCITQIQITPAYLRGEIAAMP